MKCDLNILNIQYRVYSHGWVTITAGLILGIKEKMTKQKGYNLSIRITGAIICFTGFKPYTYPDYW